MHSSPNYDSVCQLLFHVRTYHTNSLQGPDGEEGPPGDKGEKGRKGGLGLNGERGEKGEKGNPVSCIEHSTTMSHILMGKIEVIYELEN